MQVELINFRQYHQAVFTFEPNQLTLITGRSGGGKSTIFEAIRWCITGKLQKISPHNLPKGKTSVRVTFPDGTSYYRLNSPKRFEVTLGSTSTCADKNKLDEIELNELYWNATTYLRQLDFHPLLDSTESDKLELITSLAIRNNDPSGRINEIKILMGTLSTKISKDQAVVANLKRQLAKELLANQLTEQDLEYPPMITIQGEEIDDIDIVTQKITAFETRKTELHAQMVEYQVNQKRKADLVKGISKSKEDLAAEIDLLTREIDLHTIQREYLNTKRERDELENKLKLLRRGYIEPTNPLPIKEWDDAEIIKATEQLNKYNINANMAKKYKLAYNSETINNRILFLKDQIDQLVKLDNTQRQINLLKDQYNEYQRVKREYQLQQNLLTNANDKLASLVEVPSATDRIKVIENQIMLIDSYRNDEYYEAERELQQSVLTCPHCAGHVKYQRNALLKIDHYNPSQAKATIEEIIKERELKRMEYNQEHQELLIQNKEFNTYKTLKKKYEQEVYRITTTLNSLEKSLASYKTIPELPSVITDEITDYSGKVKMLSAELNMLSNIKFYTPPEIDADQMNQDNLLIKVYQRKSEIDRLTEQLSQITLPDQIISLSYSTIKETKANISILEDQLRRLNEADQIILGTNPVKSYEQVNKAINQLRSSLATMNTINRLIIHQNEINQLDEELSYLAEDLEVSGNLLAKMEEAKYASLIVIVNKLNKKVNNYLRQLFLDPIIFRLDMFRENKTGKKDIKPKVNVNLNYKGHDVDLKSLSGGEYARVSLCILLALAKINKSPLVMMDESLGSLEQDDLKRTVNFIKYYNRKHARTILYIGHGETTGWYDRLLPLNE